MSVILPIGLTYYIPANDFIELSAEDITSVGGRVGPVTLKITNPPAGFGPGQTAFLAWSAPTTPPTPPAPEYYNIQIGNASVDFRWLYFTVEIIGGVSFTVTEVTNTSNNWSTTDYVDVDGADIGGVSGTNNCRVDITAVNGSGGATAMAYVSGLIPGFPSPTQPTTNNPTATVSIGAGQTEYVQIPNSIQSPNFLTLTLSVGGAAVYATPVQIVA